MPRLYPPSAGWVLAFGLIVGSDAYRYGARMKTFALVFGWLLIFFGTNGFVSLLTDRSHDPLAGYEALIGAIFLLSGLLLVVRTTRLRAEAKLRSGPPSTWDQAMWHKAANQIPPRPDRPTP